MTYSYSLENLGAGTIGGNGFWLVWDCKIGGYYPYGRLHYFNTNLVSERLIEEACTFNQKLPYIGDYTSLEFHTPGDGSWIPYNMYQAAFMTKAPYFLTTPLGYRGHYLDTGVDIGGNDLWVNHYRWHPGEQRHAHRVQFMNLSGTGLVDAARIQVGNTGYSDPLPGLFVIKPIPGTIEAGYQALITIRQYNNKFISWSSDKAGLYPDTQFSFGDHRHFYFRDTDNAVTVSLAVDNANIHIIPGISITFDTTLLDSDSMLIAIGYEYVNARSELGDLGSINGNTSFFFPQSAHGLTPLHEIGNGGFEYQAWNDPTFAGTVNCRPDNHSWQIYNVTGTEQSGCQFHIRSFVRLDQGNAVTPFAQWFMGCVQECQLAESQEPYPIRFKRFKSGTPNLISIVPPSGLGTTIREVNPTTFVPTGTVHLDGLDLKVGVLYRWDEMGVYFVLAADISNSSTAQVWLRHGSEWAFHVKQTSTDSISFAADYAPLSLTVGTWGMIGGGSYPGINTSPEELRTGVIQTQGYAFSFTHPDLEEGKTSWLNHHTEVYVSGYIDLSDTDVLEKNPYEYCVMVTCDDPRYFQVVPCTFQAQPSWHYSGPLTPHFDWEEFGTSVVAQDEQTFAVAGTISVQCVEQRLVVMAHQIDPLLLDFLAANGIEVL
jgi:hypothetical protein